MRGQMPEEENQARKGFDSTFGLRKKLLLTYTLPSTIKPIKMLHIYAKVDKHSHHNKKIAYQIHGTHKMNESN